MENINLLIKPSSSACNLKCQYCFYNDVAENRGIKNFGFMKEETMEKLVKEVFVLNPKIVNFAFQGGEPTLIGVDFFKSFHKFVEKYKTPNSIVNFSIQTNGYLIDKKWIELFNQYKYLIGVSLDGNKYIHDTFRVNHKGEGTYSQIAKNIKLLAKNNVDFNILCVVNKKTTENTKLIYEFFKNSKYKYLQFIPCLDKLTGESNEDFSLTTESYGKFLDELFNLWYEDFKKNKYISVRYFDNLLQIFLGRNPESCDMYGRCSVNTVVESNGNIYPCDFYVLDEFCLGNVNDKPLEEMLKSETAFNFIKSSMELNPQCKICKYLSVCRGGCRRHKNEEQYNRFCESFKYFFDRNYNKLIECANIIRNNFR